MKRLLLALLLTLPGWADPLSEARKAIQAEYDRSNQAYERRDLEKSLACYSQDFVFTMASGQRCGLKEHRANRKRTLEVCSDIHARSKIIKIQLSGQNALVQVDEHYQKMAPGFWPGTKTPSKFSDTAQDTWRKTADGWKITSSTNLVQHSSYLKENKHEKVGYLRVIRRDGHPDSLEAQISTFRNSKGQVVDLVSALHVGERSYYKQLNQEFKSYDAVLYELIAPDNVVPEANEPSDNALSDGQMMLTNMLGLTFQLNEINYKARNFVHADLTPEQLFESMDKRGESAKQMIFQILQESLGDTTDIDPVDALALNVAMPRIMVRGARPSDHALLRRVFAASFEKIEKITAGLSGPNGSTLINVRNQKAIEVMQREFGRGKRRLAIFYGAGHMVDLEARLKKLGFQAQSVRFLKAWDLREPKPAEVRKPK